MPRQRPRNTRMRRGGGGSGGGKYSKLSSEDEISPYQYKPLAHRHIRLVQVRGSLLGHRILAKFTDVSLDSLQQRGIKYRCISYQWGSSECVDRVWFNNSREFLNITRSASSVLRYLIRARVRGYIWIDALCIDQGNAREKGVQVPLMREVYSEAKTVVAYLGEKSADSDVAMQFVKLLGKRCRKLEMELRRFKNDNYYAEIGEEERNDKILELGKDVEGKWRALHNLLQRPWFNRLWIVQEIVLAQKAVIVCGKKMVPWDTLSFVLDVLRDSGLDYLLRQRAGGDEIPRHPLGVHCLFSITWILDSKRVMLPQGLQRLLLRFRSFAATDPRDFIFALLGIADDGSKDWPKADYEEPLEDIFESWTRHLILREGELRILHIAGISQPRSDLNLPSWVPDWSCRSLGVEYAETVIFGDIDQLIRYQASRGTEPEIKVRSHNEAGCLTLIGRIIDIVDTCTEIPSLFQNEHSPPPKATLMKRDRFLRDMSRLAKSMWKSNKDEQQWKTLIANRLGDKIPTKNLCAQMGRQYMSWHRSDLMYYEYARSDNFQDESDFEIWRRERLGTSDIARHRQFIKSLPNDGERAVLTTKCGFVGLGPLQLQTGDRVCIIHGASTPFILRPTKADDCSKPRGSRCRNKYQLVGECYFDSLMTGVGLKMGTLDEIVLC